MSRHFLSIIILIIVLPILLFSSVYGKNVTISGIVNNPEGEPIKKVNVTIRNLKDEIFMETTTNRKGQFKFEDVKPRFYYLLANDIGYGSKRIKINPGKNKNQVKLYAIEIRIYCLIPFPINLLVLLKEILPRNLKRQNQLDILYKFL